MNVITMTNPNEQHELETSTIVPAAAEAFAAALAAHGKRDMPTATEAYAFIREVWFDTQDDRYNELPETMPEEFEAIWDSACYSEM